MSIDISENKRLRSERTLICSGGCGALRGTGPRTTGAGARFFVVRGTGLGCAGRLYRTRPCAFFCSAGDRPPQSLPHPGHPANPGHPASDARAIKVLTDLFCLLRRRSIDIKVFQTFFSLILSILQILQILLHTECMRGTGPRATGTGVRFFRRAGAVTPIPTRCRFSCIAYLAPAIAPSSCPSCLSWPSCFRRESD